MTNTDSSPTYAHTWKWGSSRIRQGENHLAAFIEHRCIRPGVRFWRSHDEARIDISARHVNEPLSIVIIANGADERNRLSKPP